MTCPKCKSENVNIQVVNEVELKTKHHSIWWWMFWGWYWIPIKWLCFTLLALIVKLFSHKKQKAVNKQKSVAICQECGNKWEV